MPTTVFRLLLSDREENRLAERLATLVLKPIVWAKPTFMSVPTVSVAKAMVADLWRKTDNKVDIIQNATIHEMAKELSD